MRTAYALLGPTASGKSTLALTLSRELPLEIVSVDSAQVYRGMDIGTAKPSRDERARVPHHLIDVVDPDRSYSAGRWRADAIRIVLSIFERKKTPLLVGGTMLYYRALVAGLDDLPAANSQIRSEISNEAKERGWPQLHSELEKIDPQTARRIAPADAQRIQRALEVWRLTGKPLSALQGAPKSPLPFHLKAFAMVPDREPLHRRIAARFDAMLATGLIEEVSALRSKFHLSSAMPSMRTVGYRQVWEHLDGLYDRETLREKAVAATRQLAKRQLTWLRSFPDLTRLDDASAHKIRALVQEA